MQQNKILVIVLNRFTNDNRVLRQSRTLASAGTDVSVFALHEDQLPLREEIAPLHVRRFPLVTRSWSRNRIIQLFKYLECVLRMTLAGARLKPDAIHANDLNALPVGYCIARLTGAKLVYDSHELWSDPMHRKIFPKWMFSIGVRMERALARRCDAVMAASPGYSREMAKSMGIPAPAVIRNLPVSAEVLCSLGTGMTPGAQWSPLHSDLGLDRSVPLILHLGQMGAGRGLETFLRAMGQVAPPAVAVFLGGGASAYREGLRSLAEGLGIGKRVFFHDPVPPVDIYRYAAGATIGVALIESACLSYRYTLPNKTFEYLHGGLPVVASDIPEMAAVVRDYKVGELFHEGDCRELADVINKLLVSPEQLAYYRQMSFLAAQELTWSKESPKLLQIYERLLSGEPSRDHSIKISNSAKANSTG